MNDQWDLNELTKLLESLRSLEQEKENERRIWAANASSFLSPKKGYEHD